MAMIQISFTSSKWNIAEVLPFLAKKKISNVEKKNDLYIFLFLGNMYWSFYAKISSWPIKAWCWSPHYPAIQFMSKVVYMCSSLLQLALGSCDLSQSMKINSPIFQWLFDGIKVFPQVFLLCSKIKLLNLIINIFFQ